MKLQHARQKNCPECSRPFEDLCNNKDGSSTSRCTGCGRTFFHIRPDASFNAGNVSTVKEQHVSIGRF